jgi:hypothetical protein
MSDITDDAGFKQALRGLDYTSQRQLAARFVENVMPLATDDRVAHVVAVAGKADAGEAELADALHSARAATLACHTRCGSEGDWKEQAGYFVARAATAAVTPEGRQAGGPAWQAAMSARMAQTARSIDTDEDCAGQERLSQYSLLSDFLNS